MKIKEISGFDLDGVISIPGGGVYPGKDDVIITGRCTTEWNKTREYLDSKKIYNYLYVNFDVKIDEKTDESSGNHKAKTIHYLLDIEKLRVINFFEDNEVQGKIIKEKCPWVNVIILKHDLVNSTDCENY